MVSLTVIHVSLLACIVACGATRTALIRDVPNPSLCKNTAQGMWYIADDTGTVCDAWSVDPRTGCCSNGEKHSCKTCSEKDSCCSEYEYCVSCCLAPSHRAAKLYPDVHRSPGRPETGNWASAFEYCQGVCRTHGMSTSHENAFISHRHFCFIPLGRPKTEDLPALPRSLSVAKAAKGQSCSAACEAKSMVCSGAGLGLIDHCDFLREHFNCEAGCMPVAASEAPLYVVTQVPKNLNPGLCMTRTPSQGPIDAGAYCAAFSGHTERLCACQSPAPAQQQEQRAASHDDNESRVSAVSADRLHHIRGQVSQK